MIKIIPASAHYDQRTVLLHWLTAALVIVLWSLGQTIDWFPKGAPRVFARSTHISLGFLLAFVLAARIKWRFGSEAVRLAPAGFGWLDRLARFTHWLLYGLLLASVALGLTNAWVRGDSIFGTLQIPALAGTNKSLKEIVQELHGLAANALFVVALFHASAAVLHHYVWKDGVLRRMSL